jgi:methylthioribose-1-phosphate isomerase
MKFPVSGLKKNGAHITLRQHQSVDIDTLDKDCMEHVFNLLNEKKWLRTIRKDSTRQAPKVPVTVTPEVTQAVVHQYDQESSDAIKAILKRVNEMDNSKTTVYNMTESGDNRSREPLDETELLAREKYLDSAQEEASSNISNFQVIETDDDATSKADDLGDMNFKE